jgi:hypothetical protein
MRRRGTHQRPPSFLLGCTRSGCGNQNRVDDVDGGVGGLNVAADCCGNTVDLDQVTDRSEAEISTVNRRDRTGFGQRSHVQRVSTHDVVGEDRGQKFLVGQDRIEVRLRNSRKGIVGRSEDRERALTIEGVHQTGLGHGRN